MIDNCFLLYYIVANKNVKNYLLKGIGMSIVKGIFLLGIFFAVTPGFADQKARVLTETGKKWDVIFIRMHNDTIYLQVPKADGKKFNVSGHKSRFKSVDFYDGTALDFSLSEFPVEHELKLNADIGDWPGSSGVQQTHASSNVPASPHEQSEAQKKIYQDDSAAMNMMFSDNPSLTWPDTVTLPKSSTLKAGAKSDTATGSLYVETKPGLAQLYLDGKFIEGTTPITIHGVAPGKHGVRTIKDSLSAFSLVTVAPKKTAKVSLKLKKEKEAHVAASAVKKSHGLAWSFCISSAALLIGSAASYYLALDDQTKAQDAKDLLSKSQVAGSVYNQNLSINKTKSDDAALKVKISDVLLGAGVLGLGLGVVFFF
jgi:hypothetical protein